MITSEERFVCYYRLHHHCCCSYFWLPSPAPEVAWAIMLSIFYWHLIQNIQFCIFGTLQRSSETKTKALPIVCTAIPTSRVLSANNEVGSAEHVGKVGEVSLATFANHVFAKRWLGKQAGRMAVHACVHASVTLLHHALCWTITELLFFPVNRTKLFATILELNRSETKKHNGNRFRKHFSNLFQYEIRVQFFRQKWYQNGCINLIVK